MIFAVSGSNGFIGKHLVKILKKIGKVVPLDRSGTLPKKVDIVFDLAAYGNLSSQKDPVETFNANVIRVIKLLEDCRKKGVKDIVLTSSSAVLLPKKSFYSVSKMTIEEIAKLYDDLNIVVVRPSTIIGPGENPAHLIPVLIKSIKTGQKMDFVKEPKHDFLNVQNYVRRTIFCGIMAFQLKGKSINISSGKSYSNDYVRKMLEKIAGKKANINVVKSMRSYDSKEWFVKPTFPDDENISLYDSLKEMYESF